MEGDVIAFTRNLTVTGHVTGDVIAFAGEAVIDGTVDGNVRVFSRSVILQGTVGKNVTAFANSVDLVSKANVGGGMIVFAAEADLDGKMQRDLLGMIAQDRSRWLDRRAGVDTRREPRRWRPTAEIRGPATFEGRATARSGVWSQAGKPHPTEITQEVRRNRRSTARVVIRAIFSYAAALVVGILLLVIFPGFFRATLREAGGIGLPIGVGALALITGVFLLVLGVLLLFVGVGAGVAGVMAYAPILYVAQVFVGAWLGNKIMGEPPATATPHESSGRPDGGGAADSSRRGTHSLFLEGWCGWRFCCGGPGAVLLGFYRMSRVESAPSAPASSVNQLGFMRGPGRTVLCCFGPFPFSETECAAVATYFNTTLVATRVRVVPLVLNSGPRTETKSPRRFVEELIVPPISK